MTLSGGVALGVGLALASALAWSALDALRKRLARDLSAPAILLGVTAPQVPIHLALSAGSGVPSLDLPFLALTLVAAALTAGAQLLFVEAVRSAPLSLTVPYLSFTPAATLVAGLVLLGQVPGAWGLLGVVTIVAGALLLGLPTGGPRRGLLRERGSRLMLAVALLFAATNAIDRLAILRASEPVYAALLTGSITLALGSVPAVRRELLARPRLGQLALLAGIAGAAALLLQFLSYRFLYVAYVDAVKRAGGNLLAVGLGTAFFAETDLRRRLCAAGLMSVGVVLVLLEA